MRHLHITYVTDPATGNVYPIPAGGADDDAAGDDTTATDDATDDADDDAADDDSGSDDDAQLGPAGEKALREMKKRAREAERELRRLRAEMDSKPTDDDAPDPDQIRKEVEAEVTMKVARERALDKLEAKAARAFQNPELARKLLTDQSDDFLDETGNPDVEAIQEALDELLADEPYLALDDGSRFKGTADGGTRNGADKPAQLNRDDLKRMSPEEIVKAKEAGRLTTLLGAD